MLKTFADQAVIAIENARLFQELQAKTRQLASSVQELEDKSRQLEDASRYKSQYPIIPVAVKTLDGYRTYRFLIDTGADFSLAPRRLAQQIGLDWDSLTPALIPRTTS
jgi:hypothetical protein